MARKLWARESVGVTVAIKVVDRATAAAVDISGWTFACSFARVMGSNDVTLGMAADADSEGFFITDAELGSYQMKILPATLGGIGDTTGNFTMFGDIIATRPGGALEWMDDIELQVTEGPTA